jgi:hypothetical protein
MNTDITTRAVCAHFNLPESTLRHVLRRPGAPRPRMHPSARLFLWQPKDVEALARFLGRSDAPAAPADTGVGADAGIGS